MGSFRPKCNKVHGLREEKCLLRLPSVVLAKITLEPEKGEKKKKKSQMLLNVAHHLFIINLLSVNTRLER